MTDSKLYDRTTFYRKDGGRYVPITSDEKKKFSEDYFEGLKKYK